MRQASTTILKRVEVKKDRPKSSPVKGRRFDTLKDVPDIRDRMYEPTLRPLLSRIDPPKASQHVNKITSPVEPATTPTHFVK